MTEKKLKKVCKCEYCGNASEMVVTCSLEEVPDQPPLATQAAGASEMHRVKGHGVCSHCGNEAELWVDL